MDGLAKDLRLLIPAQRVLTEPEDLQAYTNDAIHYYRRSLPEAVVLPENTDEVSLILKHANKQGIPVTPRGAGSGLAGGCTPVKGGIVMDMKRMRRIIAVERGNMTAEVEAGVVLHQFHKTVEKIGLFYPPDPQSMSVCTIGGNIATRAGGPRGVKYGTTGNYVLGLEYVLPDGTIIQSGGKFVKQTVGYNLTQLLTGSEGTLAVITSAKLRLLPLPTHHKTVMVVCETLDQAAQIVSEIIANGVIPAMLEFLIKLAITVMNNYLTQPLRTDGEAYLMMDLDGSQEQIGADIEVIRSLCNRMGALESIVIEEPESSVYWKLRSNIYPLMMTLFKRVITEDITVPRERIPDFVRAAREISASLGIMIGLAGHAGDGNMHPTILEPETSPEIDIKAKEAIDKIIKRGLEMGGTISGEHGIGIHKSEYLAWDLGEHQIDLMKRVKSAFDPNNIMNPGKIWPEEGAVLA